MGTRSSVSELADRVPTRESGYYAADIVISSGFSVRATDLVDRVSAGLR